MYDNKKDTAQIELGKIEKDMSNNEKRKEDVVFLRNSVVENNDAVAEEADVEKVKVVVGADKPELVFATGGLPAGVAVPVVSVGVVVVVAVPAASSQLQSTLLHVAVLVEEALRNLVGEGQQRLQIVGCWHITPHVDIVPLQG